MIAAISDIHGDKKQALKLLQEHEVVDRDGNWAFGNNTLVNDGDSTDRGKDGIAVLRWMLNLSNQAKEQGGRVIHIMGNHDALILCMALHQVEEDYNYEHAYIFLGNGGKSHEAVSLSRLHDLRHYVQSFPMMCRVDGVLFQHADGFNLYNKIATGITPEEKIKAANEYCRTKTVNAWGAWNLFYDITDERRWQNSGELMPEYLKSFGAEMVVHGHTGFVGSEPKRYLDDTAINIDAIMSRGYRTDEERGCVLVINSPGKDIVV